MMFHVKLPSRGLAMKGLAGYLLVLCITGSCVGSRPAMQIDDYVLADNGLEHFAHKPLHAFIFENNLRNQSIERFLNEKYRTQTYADSEFWISINQQKF